MIYDLNKTTVNPFLDKTYDICIIGAGIAGIALALNLDKNLKVLLLEGGDYDYTDESQKIYEGKNIGHEYWTLDTCRIRCFGGSSNTWGRWMEPFEARDFEKKPYAKLSGWPIGKKDLDPYLEKTNDMFEMSKAFKPISDVKEWDGILKRPNEDFEGFYIHISPVDFKEKFGPEIKNRENIHCYLNANLTDMTLLDDLSSVKEVEVKNYEEGVFRVRAKKFVLATGGIENARLLLSFNKQCKKGIGNDNGFVGRYFCDHPQFEAGKFILEEHVLEAIQSDKYHIEHKYLRPSDGFMKDHKILNFGIRIETASYLKKHNSRNIFKNKIKQIVCSSKWLTDLMHTYRYSSSKTYCNIPILEEDIDGRFIINSEQIPNPLSRITLNNEEVDKFGMNQVILDWNLVDLDKRTVTEAAFAFARMFASKGIGRVKLDDWILADNMEFPGSSNGRMVGPHHMCTTRMSNDPKEGVVDSNLKVFGINNLYIAGTSVFSTGGEVNPTFAMVQMTLRLADHLNALSKS